MTLLYLILCLAGIAMLTCASVTGSYLNWPWPARWAIWLAIFPVTLAALTLHAVSWLRIALCVWALELFMTLATIRVISIRTGRPLSEVGAEVRKRLP